MSAAELVALVCCDLGAIVRGRAVLCTELEEHLGHGVSWVPANSALTPLGTLAEPNPFGSLGDLRLMPDPATHVRVGNGPGEPALELLLCDIVETDGTPWAGCPRSFLARALEELRAETGAVVCASFEHEFQLVREGPAPLAFSLAALRSAEPFATSVMEALLEAGVEPERFFGEYASHQFEIPVAPALGMAAADRAVILREIVREVARRESTHASFAALTDPEEAGNGVHVHVSLQSEDGRPLLYDPAGPGRLSALGGSFAAGILRHACALSALCAPSPASAERLRPHRWSAGAVCLAEQNREALLRIPPQVGLAGQPDAGQLRLEFRGADATANPYLALGAIVHAGLEGVRAGLPAPTLLTVDPSTLDATEAERFGVGALPATLSDALTALERDDLARSWMEPLLYDAYLSLKRAEVAATASLDLAEVCRMYRDAY